MMWRRRYRALLIQMFAYLFLQITNYVEQMYKLELQTVSADAHSNLSPCI